MNRILNRLILRSEIEKAVYSTKNREKAPCSMKYLPKFPIIIDVMHSLFNFCFDTGTLLSIWRKAMITAVPKDATRTDVYHL